MSSLANAIKRKTHKERSQPASRQKYGLLEKHKDYVIRAKDFHKKEKTIKSLTRKAEERNPDEFYFGMESARTKDGVHDGRLSEANKYTQEQLRLMKTQDVKYLSLKARAEQGKISRLKESLHFIGVAPQNKHTVFVDSPADARSFDAAEYFDTVPEVVGRAFNRPRKAQLHQGTAVVGTANKKIEKRKYASYKELTQRGERLQKVAAVASKLAYEKEVAGKGRKRKLKQKDLPSDFAAHGAVFKWKRERKR